MALVAHLVESREAPLPNEPLRRLSVDEYHELIRLGFFDANSHVELLDGYIVNKMSKNPPHRSTKRRVFRWLAANCPPGCFAASEDPITLPRSEPEPDAMLVRGPESSFEQRHPRADEILLVVEVASTSLDRDQRWKAEIYARAGIPHYWIVNIPERAIEIFSLPIDGRYTSLQRLSGPETLEVPVGKFRLPVSVLDFLGPQPEYGPQPE